MSLVFESITSRKNPRIIRACSLEDKKYRDREGLFALEGEKLLCEALNENIAVKEIFFTENAASRCEDMLARAYGCGAELFCVTNEVYGKLTYEKASQGIFAVAEKKELPLLDRAPDGDGFIILESVRDPSNVGAILRTCAALGSSRVLLSSDCADVYGYKAVRASMGAIFKTELYIADDMPKAISMLKQKGTVYAAALTDKAQSIADVKFCPCDSIVIGNEGHGVSEAVLGECDSAVIIPMQCGTESLNASVAAAILIWERASATQKAYSASGTGE